MILGQIRLHSKFSESFRVYFFSRKYNKFFCLGVGVGNCAKKLHIGFLQSLRFAFVADEAFLINFFDDTMKQRVQICLFSADNQPIKSAPSTGQASYKNSGIILESIYRKNVVP